MPVNLNNINAKLLSKSAVFAAFASQALDKIVILAGNSVYITTRKLIV